METKDPKSTESAATGEGAESKDAKADATSGDTLKDVEENEGYSNGDESAGGDGVQAPAPSPDGQLDDRNDRGPSDAGPM